MAHGDARGAQTDAQRPWAVAGTALVVIFGAVKLVRPLGQTFTPLGDVSFIELGVRQALHGGTALGPYSRFGFHHLGPVLFYLLSPFYAVTGESSRSLFLGAWVIQGSCAIGIVWLVRMRAGELASRVMAIVLALYLLLGQFEHFIDPWNPRMLALPLLLLIVSTAGACAGSPGSFVVGLVAGSYLIETHLGLMPLTVVFLVFGALGLWHARRRAPVDHRLAFVVVAIGALALMWVGPLWQQATHGSDGNLGDVVEFTLHPPARFKPHSHSLSDSVRIVSTRATTVPFRNSRGQVGARPRTAVTIALAAAGVIVALFTRRRSTFLATLALSTPIGLTVAVLSATRVVGAQEQYLFYWTEALVLPVIAATGTLLLELIPASRRVLSFFVGGILVVLAAVCLRSIAHGRVTASSDGVNGRAIAARIESEVGTPRQTFTLRAAQYSADPGAIFIQLEKDGYHFHVDPTYDLYSGTIGRAARGPTFIVWPSIVAPPPAARAHLGRFGKLDLWRGG